VLAGSGYRHRTLKNVKDSDGTLILFTGSLTGGTKLTRDLCLRERKAFLVVDAAQVSVADAVDDMASFIGVPLISLPKLPVANLGNNRSCGG
jgi:hypothetical protein